MPRCVKCGHPVMAAHVICGSCKKQAVETAAQLKDAICHICGWRGGTFYGQYRLEDKCSQCEPARLLGELMQNQERMI